MNRIGDKQIVMKFGMKKSDIAASLLIIIVCVLLMIMLWLRTIGGDGTLPSYRFLGDQNPVACREEKTGSVDKCYVYSFEGDCNDFNDVCSQADAELIGAGFIDRTLPLNKSRESDYWLKSSFPRGPVKIKIYNNCAYNEKYNAIGNKDDWIVVEIMYQRNWQQLF